MSALIKRIRRWQRNCKRISEAAEKYTRIYGAVDLKALKRDLIRGEKTEGFSADEYVSFAFYEKSNSERRDYISLKELRGTFSKSAKNTFPRDKYGRFLLFQGFFRRDIIHIIFDNSEEERVTFTKFKSIHESFVAKPVQGEKGKGILCLEAHEVPDLESLYKKVGTPVLLEEVIQQGPELGRFHPSSVNTLRLATGMNRRGEFSPLFALLRTGQGGKFVDNVGSGGLVSLVDIDSGTVLTDGLYDHQYFACHPDTQVRFKGTGIPAWPELLDIAEHAHKTAPQQALIGWDFAWTINGWDLVEANPTPSFASVQALSGKGIRPLLLEKELL